MISAFTAILDANVFFGARLRSLVLYLAQTKMFRARWSEKINDEWLRNIREEQNVSLEKLEKLRALVNASVLDCLVTGYDRFKGAFKLPDSGDEHVLAAAVKAGADMIVTFNLKDFPSEILSSLGIEAKHPDDFLLDLFGISSEAFIDAVRDDFEHYKEPPFTFDQYVVALQRAGVPKTARQIEELRILIDTAKANEN